MSKQAYRVCCCFQRKFRFKEAEAPDEIKALFARYSENGVMTVEHLRRFLKEVQGEDEVTMEEAESVMESIIKELKHLHILHRKVLHIEAFFRYLSSDTINYALTNKVHHDMTAPLSHYFIYTSHNSYLTGNQISSDCSDVPIIKALEKGVRVIELDMWPNSTKDNVDIYHGRTLTTPVDLIKCLRSIRKHAFVASEFPLILTLEDHLTPDLQAKVAEMVTQTFGDVLFCSGSECLSEFPSPESLKRQIIISTKPPKEYLATKSINEEDDSSQKVKKSSEEQAWGKEVSDLADHLKIDNELQSGVDDGKYQDDEDTHDDGQHFQQNAATEYKNLIAIRTRKRKGGVKEWLKIDPTNVTRISLGEEKFEKIVLSHGADIVRFTQRNLLRIFPKATRLDSSNYNPLIGWTHGAQMVALNMQGHGRYLWLMQGMFRANGGCGYVKKPDILLQVGPHNEVFDPKRRLPVKKTLKVKVYMGEGWNLDFHCSHFDTYSPPDFYVKVGIAGVSADSLVKKTKILEDNWIPTWNEEFEFQLTVPQLALLRIEVHEYDLSGKDDFGGQTCLPVSELRKGIRSVPLYNEKGEKYRSVKLLMRFDFV